MTFLDKLHSKDCPLPLWKLKLKPEDYEELRQLLEKRTHYVTSDPFNGFERECALFFAEYWRRGYVEETHNVSKVYAALKSDSPQNYKDEFYDRAKKGGRDLGIEKISGNNERNLDSLLYQGGLPMKAIVTGASPAWSMVARRTFYGNMNFDDLNLGYTAIKSLSLREFRDQLVAAVESDQYMRLPYYCESERDESFIYIKNLAKEVVRLKRQERPFDIDWTFMIDEVGKKLQIKYVAKGEQNLTKSFTERFELPTPDFFTVLVKVNGKVASSFDYQRNFCIYAVKDEHPYNEGDRISIYLSDCDKEMVADELDLTIPHLLYRNLKGDFELGNRMGRTESFLFMPEGWNVDSNCQDLKQTTYDWNGQSFLGVRIPANFRDEIVVKKEDECIKFGSEVPLRWTELIGAAIYMPNVDKMLYDVSKCRFALCSDTDDTFTQPRITSNVEFRNKWQTKWSDTPSFGEIVVRVKSNGDFITPTNRFINVGEGFSFFVIDANDQTCQVKINWHHGNVIVKEGDLKVNDVWQIQRADTTDNKLHLTFVPNEDSQNQFTLIVDAPFKQFVIKDEDGIPVANDGLVPYADLEKYQYYLIGQNIRKYTYGSYSRELRWEHNVLYIWENGRQVRSIPYEGSLLSLFPSRSLLRALLEKTSHDIVKAEVPVTFTTSDGKTLSFAIKDNPFRVMQVYNKNKVVITNQYKNPIVYKGVLKLIKMDEPNQEHDLFFDEDEGYVIPELVKAWGKTMLIGKARGRLLPKLVDISHEWTEEERSKNYSLTPQKLRTELATAKLTDSIWTRTFAWFDKIHEEDIPASSLFELRETAHNPETLLCLTFVKYAMTEESTLPILLEELKTFSSDLAFSWYWLLPWLKSAMFVIANRIGDIDLGNTILTQIYMKWACQKGDKTMEYIGAMSNTDSYCQSVILCLDETIESFKVWIKQLCEYSLLEQYANTNSEVTDKLVENIVRFYLDNCRETIMPMETRGVTDYVDVRQDYNSEFFDQKKYIEPGKMGNELWMFKRVRAVADHFFKGVNLFEQLEEIRRSIIFCRKACNRQFIIALNNILAKGTL